MDILKDLNLAIPDGQFVSIGSIEPQFYALLRKLAGLDDPAYDAQMDARGWPALKAAGPR